MSLNREKKLSKNNLLTNKEIQREKIDSKLF